MNKVDLVRQLRNDTGMGISECMKALTTCNWDLQKATSYVKEHATPSDKPVGAGAVFSYIHHNNNLGAIVHLQCGTDFVAKSEEFLSFGNALARHIAAMNPKSVEELFKQTFISDNLVFEGGFNVEYTLNCLSGKFNEPIKVAQFYRISV